MSFPCQCPPDVKSPFHYQTYQCTPETIYVNYYASFLLVNAPYFNYLRTTVKNSTEYRKKFSYIVPIYKFQYVGINNPDKVLRIYTYEELFNIYLVSEQYKTLMEVPKSIKDKWDKIDKDLYCNLLLLPITDALYNAVLKANEYLQLGLEYGYTFNIPKNIILISKIPKDQQTYICWTRDTLITISRNAQQFINAYQFNGLFTTFLV